MSAARPSSRKRWTCATRRERQWSCESFPILIATSVCRSCRFFITAATFEFLHAKLWPKRTNFSGRSHSLRFWSCSKQSIVDIIRKRELSPQFWCEFCCKKQRGACDFLVRISAYASPESRKNCALEVFCNL